MEMAGAAGGVVGLATATPLTFRLVGVAAIAPGVAWKPNEVVLPAATLPLYDTLEMT